MKASKLLSGLKILSSTADLSLEVTGVVSDTRKVLNGHVFVCIEGLRFDAHTAAREMIEKGAAFVVVSRPVDADLPQVLVEDTREALSALYAAWFDHPEQKFRYVVGITGTNGKTSTSMILRHILTDAGHKCGLIGTTKYVVGDAEYEAPLTTPDPEALFSYFAEMIEAGCDTLIMEVSSHSLSQKRVSPIPFTVGIFTNLTQDHLDYHGTMEAYRKEKEKLFSMCRVGLINSDDPSAEAFLASAACKTYTYGTKSADFKAENILLAAHGVEYDVKSEFGDLRAELYIPGRFSVYNSLAAASCALWMGVDSLTLAASLQTMPGVDGRMQRLPNTQGVTVLIDYAHTPDALENVLQTIRGVPHGKIYTIFGCGGDRDPKKRPIMGDIACRYSDRAIVTSDNPRTEEPEAILADILAGCKDHPNLYRVIVDRTEAIRFALSEAEEGDVVLLAGKGHEEYVIDKTGKHPYSEKEIVRQFYSEKQKERT